MADLAGNNPITATGDYDVPTIAGQKYLLRFAGTGYAITLKTYDGPTDSFVNVDNGTFPGADGETEARLIAPSTTLRITVGTWASNIGVTLIPVV
jgi:hypothetical protein